MKLILPCLYHNVETLAKEDAGLETNYTEFDVREVTIYKPPVVISVMEDDKSITTKLFIEGTSLHIPMKPKEVSRLIDLAINDGFVDGYAVWELKNKENA